MDPRDWRAYETIIRTGIDAHYERKRRAVEHAGPLLDAERVVTLDNLRYVTIFFEPDRVTGEAVPADAEDRTLEERIVSARISVLETDTYLEEQARTGTDALAAAFSNEPDLNDPAHPMETALPAANALMRLRAVGMPLGVHDTRAWNDAFNLYKQAANLTENFAKRTHYLARRPSVLSRVYHLSSENQTNV